ncbi:MAG: hypothetical protein ACLRK3_06640 [Ruminococcus sp.]
MDVFTRCGILKIKDEKIFEPKAIIEMNDSFSVFVTKYPNLLQRFFIRAFLGWKIKKVDS